MMEVDDMVVEEDMMEGDEVVGWSGLLRTLIIGVTLLSHADWLNRC